MSEQDWKTAERERAYIRDLEFRVSTGALRDETVDSITATAMVERVWGPLQSGIYIEVGPGYRPYAFHGARRFDQEQMYVAYEGGASRYRQFSDTIPNLGWIDPRRSSFREDVGKLQQLFAVGPPNVQLRLVDAQHMDLPNASPDQAPAERVREVYMNSVMIANGMHPDSIERIMQECARVLDKDGQLIIRDEHPADFHVVRTRFLELFDALDRAGFKRRTVVMIYQGSQTMEALAKQFDNPNDSRLHPWTGSYVICEKGEEGITTSIDPRGTGRKFLDLFRNWG